MAAVNRFDASEVAARAALPGTVNALKSYPGGSGTGDPVQVTVTYDHQMLTGYLSAVIPSFPSNIVLTSHAEMRLEQPGN